MKEDELTVKPKPLDKDFPYHVCAYYRLHSEFEDKISQYTIFYDDSKNKASNLVSFCRTYSDRKINIKCSGDSQEVVEQVSAMFPNVRICLDITNIGRVDYLKENNIPFYFDDSLPANNLSQLESLINLGVCAIYVSDELTNNIENVSEICHENDVELRCVLNKVPRTGLQPSYHDTIYDPRCIDEYKKWYDVFEFSLDSDVEKEKHKFRVLFHTFFVDKNWHGDLGEINEDIAYPYDLRGVDESIAEYKNTCQRRCMMRPTSACRRCERIIKERQAILAEKGWTIRNG